MPFAFFTSIKHSVRFLLCWISILLTQFQIINILYYSYSARNRVNALNLKLSCHCWNWIDINPLVILIFIRLLDLVEQTCEIEFHYIHLNKYTFSVGSRLQWISKSFLFVIHVSMKVFWRILCLYTFDLNLMDFWVNYTFAHSCVIKWHA